MMGNGDGYMDHLWAVIPAGGSGTRLWPLSRAERPKFLLPLLGEHSLLQETWHRINRMVPAERILVVCGTAHATAIARQLPDLLDENIIIEPSPNGTGPALSLANALIQQADADAIMASFAADHNIEDLDAFEAAVRAAAEAATQGDLVTIGLTPTRPETGYGYIERSETVRLQSEHGTAWRAERFVEKPNLETAREYVISGKFLWNASMFIWKVESLQSELGRQQPAIAAGVSEIASAWHREDRERVLMDVWARIPNTTIDTGIMEHALNVAVVPTEMGWSDVGDWHGLGELLVQDTAGNALRGNVMPIDSSNNVVWSESGRLVSIIGMDEVVIVDTADALMVVKRDRSQDVRSIVAELHARDLPHLT